MTLRLGSGLDKLDQPGGSELAAVGWVERIL